jgi:CBS-domain-containing membrane protein
VEETEAPEVESDAEVSFHGTEAFLPDVKIKTNNEEITEAAEITSPNVNKHEEEMRRLIEEVEKR